MVGKTLRGGLIGALAALAVPMSGLAVLAGTPPASADPVIGSVTDLGERYVDVDGTPKREVLWNASFGTRYLFMTGIVPSSGSSPSGPIGLTAVDLATGQYVADWTLPQFTSPTDSLVADGDAVWASTRSAHDQHTQLFKVGESAPVADFPHSLAVAVVDKRAYLFGDGVNTPAVTVLDDDPSSPGYLSPLATPTASTSLADPSTVRSGGRQLFVKEGAALMTVDADPASSTYLAVTGTAPVPSGNQWLAADAGGHRLLSWQMEGPISVYSARDGGLVADGSLDPCGGRDCAIQAALSPDGRRAYVITSYVSTRDADDEVRVYDMTTSSRPQLAAIESFAGATSLTLGVSPDGTRLTTGGERPKIVTVPGYASTPTITGPHVPLPGQTLTVDLGDWSPTPTWQWLRDDRPIPGTTDATTYRLTEADLGARLTVHAVVDGLAARTSAPVAVPQAPRITATVSGQHRAGWYRGRARVTFTCTAGTAKVVHCPAATTLHAGADQRVTGTVSDQYGLTATVVTSGIDVCDRCVIGAGFASGRWVVHRGQRYTVAILGGPRPRSAGLARPGQRATLHPVAAHHGDAVGGRIVWLVDVTAPRGRGHWSLRYRQGGSTARVPLTVD